MLDKIDKMAYPITLGVVIIIAFLVFGIFKKFRKTNRRLEIYMASYIVFHEVGTVFVFYLMFGKGPGMMQTDLSPYVFTLSAFPLFTGKTVGLRKSLMPYLLISGMVTMATSKPGFSYPMFDDVKYMPMFIEGFLTYVKHLLILIIGIYFIFTNEKYIGREGLLILFIPVTMTSGIMVGSGIYYGITDNPRYGRVSTGLLLPSQIPWGGYETYIEGKTGEAKYISQTRYESIIKDHDGAKYFEKIGDKYYPRLLITKSLGGDEYYSGDASYVLITHFSNLMNKANYGVVTILYVVTTAVGFIIALISQFGKYETKGLNERGSKKK